MTERVLLCTVVLIFIAYVLSIFLKHLRDMKAVAPVPGQLRAARSNGFVLYNVPHDTTKPYNYIGYIPPHTLFPLNPEENDIVLAYEQQSYDNIFLYTNNGWVKFGMIIYAMEYKRSE